MADKKGIKCTNWTLCLIFSYLLQPFFIWNIFLSESSDNAQFFLTSWQMSYYSHWKQWYFTIRASSCITISFVDVFWVDLLRDSRFFARLILLPRKINKTVPTQSKWMPLSVENFTIHFYLNIYCWIIIISLQMLIRLTIIF